MIHAQFQQLVTWLRDNPFSPGETRTATLIDSPDPLEAE